MQDPEQFEKTVFNLLRAYIHSKLSPPLGMRLDSEDHYLTGDIVEEEDDDSARFEEQLKVVAEWARASPRDSVTHLSELAVQVSWNEENRL